MANEAKVIASLRAFARQIGINRFWWEWDEAGHFELRHSNSNIDDIALSSWALNGGRLLAAAFYALQPTMQKARAVRLAAGQLDDVAYEAFFDALEIARKNRRKIPKKIRLAKLRVFSGARPVEVSPIEKLKPVFSKHEPKPPRSPPSAPVEIWGHPINKRAVLDIDDRLYEDLLALLGKPSSVQRYETCGVFFPFWKKHKVAATIHPVGFAVRRLVLRATKSD